ncbi:Dihydrofolate reductase [Penicillium angulare]|uniref:Dihydrofolate reductase n=1 Tax=Penicillium angulare TaxID=116970 RepID=A0A9W9JZR3_9EURO|nr:Dihydrofolate reductase [Penicillium angulare]
MPPPTTSPIHHSLPLTLIVATTPIRVASAHAHDETRLGIGLNGTLPWPRIKTDMSFFARVTSHPPQKGTTNAIIMGRKTYDSVPKSLRPLGKRISVVISRDTTGSVSEGVRKELEAKKAKMAAKAAEEGKEKVEEPGQDTDAIVMPSLDAALKELEGMEGLGKIFVIGGAEIYGAALRDASDGLKLHGRPVRVVMTNVIRKPEGGEEVPFECDTFWPLDSMDNVSGWRSVGSEELSEWVGEEVTWEWKREGECEVQMVGFERLG